MIRFVTGIVLLAGGVGGIEQETATLAQGMMICLLGLGLMLWALPKLASQD